MALIRTTNWKLTFTDLILFLQMVLCIIYQYIFCGGKTSIDTANIFLYLSTVHTRYYWHRLSFAISTQFVYNGITDSEHRLILIYTSLPIITRTCNDAYARRRAFALSVASI